MKTKMEAYLAVAEMIPVDDSAVLRRLDRADKDVLGYGYDIVGLGDGTYQVSKLSTAPIGSSDNGSSYHVSRQSCSCPDVASARAGLCKHRLAVMILEEMEK